ncbi:hypothetical protein Bbelb_117030 [Branchiostoma belcheri]|nr:hypothetical protein Bbelb_117030 [Branchiostoma belcheri]
METVSRVLVIAATFVLFPHIVGASADFTHHASLDEYGKFLLSWKYDDEKIELEARVQTTGWVGLGLSPNEGMPGSDIAIGWVKDGTAHLTRTSTSADFSELNERYSTDLIETNRRFVRRLSGHKNDME